MNGLDLIYHDSRTNISDVPTELLEYLPQSKYDPDSLLLLSKLDQSKINILLPQLLVWIQDINWPNASRILPFLLAGGQHIIPEIEWVLNGKDEIWKANCIRYILMDLQSDVVQPLFPILKRIVDSPTRPEMVEEVHLEAARCIEQLHTS